MTGWVLVSPVSLRAQLVPTYAPETAVFYSVRASSAASSSHETEFVATSPGVSDFVSIAAAVGISVGASLVSKGFGPAPCAPCDPAGVPGIDRGTIRTIQETYSLATDLTVLGMGAGTWVDLGRRDPGGDVALTASIESVAWAGAATQIMKVAFRRIRPFMYSEDALEHANNPDVQQSFPSGHAALAFALSTSYFLSMHHFYGQEPYWVFAPAAFVAVGRVLAGKHWITDVLAGAAVGTATALIVHEVRVR